MGKGPARAPARLEAAGPKSIGRFLQAFSRIAKEQGTLDAWLDEWVYGLANQREYVEKIGDAHWDGLRHEPALSGEVDYGRYA